MATEASWDALRVFVAVFRAGSFSAAADELGLAQSSVSEQVARLERNLGYPLLDRSPVGTRATERGHELAARISSAVDAMTIATASEGPGERTTVFLGGPAEFLSEVVLPHLWQGLPNEIGVAARFGQAEELLDELRAGALDLLVSTVPARGPDLASTPIYDEEFFLVAHPNFEGDAANLTTIPVLSYGPELPIIRRYWRSVFDSRPTDLRIRLIAPDLRTLLRLTLDGAGMSVLPDYLVRPHLATGDLVTLHTPKVSPLNTLYAATHRGRRSDPMIRQVRELVTAIGRDAAGEGIG